jgi:hypothetical protein
MANISLLPTSYPTTIDTYTTQVPGDIVRATHYNGLAGAVIALETFVNTILVPGVVFTDGSVPFAGPTGLLTQDNASFSFDDAANRLTVTNLTVPTGLTLTGATITGAPTWSSSQAITLSTAAQPNITSLGTLASNLLFVDATYDIGASGATRPRDLFLSRNAVIGGTLGLTGLATFATLTVTGTLTLTGATVAGAPTWSSAQAITLSTAAQPNITSLGTLAANLLFVDATYDIGASGATRPRDLFLSRNAVIGGTLGVTGAVTHSSTTVLTGAILSNLIFTDNTYDIGASGATRPRNLFLSGNLNVAGQLQNTAAVGFYIQGLTYANNSVDATNDIDIAIGMATSNDAAQANRRTMTLATALTKRSDAVWAVGTNAGMLDTGVVGDSDYYLWLIMRSDTGVVDVLSSLSSTDPTMPTNYDFKRLIGWFKRVAGTIVTFDTYETDGGGLEFIWDSPTLDINLANTLTTSRRTDAVKVPLNFSVEAHLNVILTDAGTNNSIIYCPDQADLAPSYTAAPLANVEANTTGNPTQLFVRTSAAGLIAARSTTATMNLYAVSTMGFTWGRRN